jgi:hypothetical protein
LIKRQKMRPPIRLVYFGFIVSWFCLLFVVHEMNPPHRKVSLWILIALGVVAPAYAIFGGFLMRKQFFRLSTEAISQDPDKASKYWRLANLIGFCCAINLAIYGAALRVFGTGWLVPGVFFGMSFSFLVLWRPQSRTVSTSQLL